MSVSHNDNKIECARVRWKFELWDSVGFAKEVFVKVFGRS
jgi:hypothetical protein